MKTILITLLLSTIITTGHTKPAESYYFVFLNKNPDKEKLSEKKVNELQKAHLKNIERLLNEGIIVAAGPFNGGGGLFILKSESIEDVYKSLETDQAIAANRFIIEIFPLHIYNGHLCDVPDNYEMGTFQFIRLYTNSITQDDLNKAIYDNRLYMKKLQYEHKLLLFHGKFNDKNDGLLIIDTNSEEDARELMESHPSVINGNITYELKTLWIAKETFCKK